MCTLFQIYGSLSTLLPSLLVCLSHRSNNIGWNCSKGLELFGPQNPDRINLFLDNTPDYAAVVAGVAGSSKIWPQQYFLGWVGHLGVQDNVTLWRAEACSDTLPQVLKPCGPPTDSLFRGGKVSRFFFFFNWNRKLPGKRIMYFSSRSNDYPFQG